MSSKKLSPSQLKKFRSDVAKLKKKGLVSNRVDARSQRPTRHMLKQVAIYDDVLSGKAKVVSAPKAKIAKEFKDRFRVKGKHIVVPADKNENVRFSKKNNEVTATGKRGGKKYQKHYVAGTFEKTEKLPKGNNTIYQIRFANGQVFSFDTKEDVVAFMFPYETKTRNPFKDWQKYVEVVSWRG